MIPMSSVLIAEDDPVLAEFLSDFLTEEGYEVTLAIDGLAALHHVIRHTPSAILLDGHMPRLDGFTFARIYRALPGPHALLALMTGDPDAAHQQDLPAGVALLPKPFALDELSDLLERLVRRPVRTALHLRRLAA